MINGQQLILGLDGHKIFKTWGNVIRLPATEEETAKLIRKARTDSESSITYQPERRPEVGNLLTIAAGFTDRAPESLARSRRWRPIHLEQGLLYSRLIILSGNNC